jgi:hypothetical protein
LNIPAEIQIGIDIKLCLYADNYKSVDEHFFSKICRLKAVGHDIISNRMLLAEKN